MRAPMWAIPLAAILGITTGLLVGRTDRLSRPTPTSDNSPASYNIYVRHNPQLSTPVEVDLGDKITPRDIITYRDDEAAKRMMQELRSVMVSDYARLIIP